MYPKLFILLILFISSCNGKQEVKTRASFFDVKGFFEAESKRLTANHYKADKRVSQNELSEEKRAVSVNWEDELALFVSSDINKPAWRDSYRIKEDSIQVSYMAIDTNLRTRYLQIKKDKLGRPVYFRIKNITLSQLYESSEELTYIPDSIYTINKNQRVRFLGDNNYRIIGKVMK